MKTLIRVMTAAGLLATCSMALAQSADDIPGRWHLTHEATEQLAAPILAKDGVDIDSDAGRQVVHEISSTYTLEFDDSNVHIQKSHSVLTCQWHQDDSKAIVLSNCNNGGGGTINWTSDGNLAIGDHLIYEKE